MEINNTVLNNTIQQYEYELDNKNGINFKITRINEFLNKDFGILYLGITNILNGKSDNLPIIIMTDENNLGGSISVESNNNSSNPNLTI